MNRTIIILFMELLLLLNFSESACTLPTELDGSWYDSEFNAVITFTRNSLSVSGWSYSVYSKSFTTFTCVESDDTVWLFRSDTTENIFGLKYMMKCVQYTQITNYSYNFYLKSDEEPESSNNRIVLVEESVYDAGVTISQICNPTSGPGKEEFHVLVKEANMADVKQTFPNALLGNYAYSVYDGSTTSCGTGSVWDDCTNTTIMKLNYTQCSKQMFGSTGGEFYATYSVTSGSTTYVILINSDSTTSNRFTCLAVSGSKASSNPGSCIKQQSATSRTSDANSVLVTLTAYILCPLTNDAASEESSSNVGVIVAVVIILLLLIVAAIAVGYVIYYKRIHRRFPWQKNIVGNNNEENLEKMPEKFSKETETNIKDKNVTVTHK